MGEFRLLPPLAAVLIAGCGGPGQGESAKDTAAAAPPRGQASGSRSSEPAPPPASGTIPASLIGVYDVSLEACAKPGDGRLTVSPTELRFHESIGTVRRVAIASAGPITVEADYQGEGESWRSTRELKLGDGGKSLTVSDDDSSLVRVRCPVESR